MKTLTLVTQPEHGDYFEAVMRAQVIGFGPTRQLRERSAVQMTGPDDVEVDGDLWDDLQVDWCMHPGAARIRKLLICDMDSTIIGQECLDELAQIAGTGDKVAAITERAMAGELDFAMSLQERVGTLRGQKEDILETVFQDKIRLNPGARTLVATMNHLGAKTALVSGGFTFFSAKVAAMAGFSVHFANVLEQADGHLSGTVGQPILDAQAKLDHLRALVDDPMDALAMGDGANDLAMVEAAGLGIAYRPKPILAESAHGTIRHTDLATALYFQGIPHTEWAKPV